MSANAGEATAVSLFSGVGGMDEGLRRAGFRHVLMCEGGGDPNGTREERRQWARGVYRRAVLRARFPGVPVADDVRDVAPVAGRRWERNGPGASSNGELRDVARWTDAPVDLLCGGFPCQDLSVAGRRAGLDGARSSLFYEFARVADALRPRWLLVENVPGLLSSNGGRDFGVVLGTLADLGYGLAWRILDSRYFGVPQRRRRVFVVGALADDDPRAAAERAGQVLAVGTRCPGHPATRGEAGPDVAVASLSGLGSGGPDDNDGQGGRLIADTVRSHPRPGSNSNGNLVATTITLASDPISARELAQPSTRRNGDPGVVQYGASVRRLMPSECEALQGLPRGWTDLGGTPDSRRYAVLGDAVTVPVAEWIGRRILAA